MSKNVVFLFGFLITIWKVWKIFWALSSTKTNGWPYLARGQQFADLWPKQILLCEIVSNTLHGQALLCLLYSTLFIICHCLYYFSPNCHLFQTVNSLKISMPANMQWLRTQILKPDLLRLNPSSNTDCITTFKNI